MILVCDICGDRSVDVRPGLVAWRDPAQPYASIDRCSDVDSCRARVENSDQEWPVQEAER